MFADGEKVIDVYIVSRSEGTERTEPTSCKIAYPCRNRPEHILATGNITALCVYKNGDGDDISLEARTVTQRPCSQMRTSAQRRGYRTQGNAWTKSVVTELCETDRRQGRAFDYGRVVEVASAIATPIEWVLFKVREVCH